MTGYVALLRAVNVGGTGKLPMAELKAVCEAVGFGRVRTYIASGNVVFDARGSEAQVKAALETKLEAYAGKKVGVIVRTPAEMKTVLADNPFPDKATNRTVAIFLDKAPAPDALDKVSGVNGEELRLGRREIYVHYGDGMADSKLKIPAAAAGTARNMNTVAKLAAMAAELLSRSPIAMVLFAVTLLGACGKADRTGSTPTSVIAGNVAAEATATAAQASTPTAAPVAIKSTKDGLAFEYGWPAAASTIPELDHWLRGNAEVLRDKAQQQATRDRAAAAKAGYPFRGHSYQEKFEAVADTPRVLVLQSEGYTFTGGAHGMPITTVVIWDKQAKKRTTIDALIDIAAFKRLANDRFCKELDRQRAEKRGAPVQPGDSDGIDSFTTCVDMASQTLLPVAKRGKALDTLRIVIGPYEAGPYAEGTYTIDLPIDPGMMAAVKPAWKDAFAAR